MSLFLKLIKNCQLKPYRAINLSISGANDSALKPADFNLDIAVITNTTIVEHDFQCNQKC